MPDLATLHMRASLGQNVATKKRRYASASSNLYQIQNGPTKTVSRL